MNTANLPKFKYHPNIYDADKVLDGVVFKENVCECCGQPTNVYIEYMYCSEDVDCICVYCVANGMAAEKFNGIFIQDVEKSLDINKNNELLKRTPGYCSWQGEYWRVCCNDYCEYLGDVGYAELKELNLLSIVDEYNKENDFDFKPEDIEKGGSLAGYLFRCLHCGKYKLNIDCD